MIKFYSFIIVLVSIGTSYSIFARENCGDLNSCEDACKSLLNGNTGLDRDKDGIPCEVSLCGDSKCTAKDETKKNLKSGYKWSLADPFLPVKKD